MGQSSGLFWMLFLASGHKKPPPGPQKHEKPLHMSCKGLNYYGVPNRI